jgi:hypothetical protein
MKWWIRGSIAAGLAALAWWKLRKKPQPALAGYTTDVPYIAGKTAKQIRYAEQGRELSDYRQAEDISTFWRGPATDAEAFFKGAYWLAVAARLTGDTGLVAKARTYYKSGTLKYALPGSSWMTSETKHIVKGAADALRPHEDVKGVASILAALGAQRSQVENRQRDAQDTDPTVIAARTVQQSGEAGLDWVNSAALWIRDGLGVRRPDGSEPPWWRKWVVRGLVLGVAAVGARVYFAPHYNRAKALLSEHMSKGKETSEEAAP